MATKTVAVLNESELKDGEMKQVAFEDGQVLVSRIGDEIHATSAFCTHYGAPLAKGVLTSDGRVVCPWHGACFNVCNGDIEDAPAPTALHSFKAFVSDGKINVTADPKNTTKANMSRPPKIMAPESTAAGHDQGVVIVGGGAGAFHTIESLREHGYSKPILLLTKEPHVPIDRTKLSKSLMTDVSKLEWRSAAELKLRFGVTIRTDSEVKSVDPRAKAVTLLSGESFSYDKLVLAPGANPRVLPIPELRGEDGQLRENVFTFRGMADSVKVDNAAKEGKTAIVIGSSFISMELVITMSKRGLSAIHVIGLEDVPFEAVLGKEVGAGIMKYHQANTPIIQFHMASSVTRVLTSVGNLKTVDGVAFKTKGTEGQETETELKGDFVVLGVGVAPATDFLKNTFQLEKDGGIKVDEYLRVSGSGDVFAIGDIAVYPQLGSPEGEFRRVEHWNVASNHGRAVGKTIAADAQPFVKVPVFWSAQGQQLRYCGVGSGHDDVIIKGDPSTMKFVAYYVKKNAIVAVACAQSDPIMGKASELMRLGLMPSPEEVRNGKDLLTIDISSAATRPRVAS
ncbi:hypothetical protein EYR38_007746 [Pleurotus pulmonarius]|nr:hypothetical protein EYR38_007746 [Pleurotus pulmonarius]